MSTSTRVHRPGRAWAYAGMVLGAATSIAANIAHVYVTPHDWPTGPAAPVWQPEPGAVIGALFWPVALLIASETLARKRWTGPARRIGVAAVLLVATVAAVISYQHLHSLLVHYRESDLAAMIGPLAVDGLMIVCSLALVSADAPADDADAVRATDVAPASDNRTTVDTPAATVAAAGVIGVGSSSRRKTTAAGAGVDTGARIARLRERDPDLSTTEIARRLGVTDRTVRRYLTNATPAAEHPAADSPEADGPGADGLGADGSGAVAA